MKCGLGNWGEVSDQFVKTKQFKECEEHYFSFYNKQKDDFLPKNEDYIVKGNKALGRSGVAEVQLDDEKNARNLRKLKEY